MMNAELRMMNIKVNTVCFIFFGFYNFIKGDSLNFSELILMVYKPEPGICQAGLSSYFPVFQMLLVHIE